MESEVSVTADNRVISDHYSAMAEAYASLEESRGRRYTSPLVAELPLGAVHMALDVGTGPGLMISNLREEVPEAFFVGIDVSTRMLHFAANKAGARPALMDAMRLGFRDHCFDLVTFSFSLFHLPSPADALREAARVLVQDGHVGIATFAESVRSEVRVVIDEKLERYGAGRPKEWPDYAVEQSSQQELLAAADSAGLAPVASWTQELEFETDRDASDILAFRRHRIDALPSDKRLMLEQEIAAALSELPEEAFKVIYPVQYLVAARR